MNNDNELITIAESTTIQVFSETNGLDPYVQEARDFVSNFEHDLSTASSRKKTASLSSKVSKLKVKLDEMGKDLVSDWKKQAKIVDSNRKSMRDALDELRDEARKPLTEWEEEQSRIEAEEQSRIEAEALLKQLNNDHELGLLLNEKITAERKEGEERRERERVEVEEAMKAEAARVARIEAERKANKEKEKIEREKKAAEERAEKAERDRIAAEERAKIQAEQAEIARIAAEKSSQEAAKKAAEDARLAQIQTQKDKDEAERMAQEKREANKRHIGKIRKEAKESLMDSTNIDEKTAKSIVLAIHSGTVRNITINY